MPSNIVKINNSDSYVWIVGDSKMTELVDWLDKNGERTTNNVRPMTDPEEIPPRKVQDEMPVAYGAVTYAEDCELKDTGMTVPVFVGNVLLNAVQALNKKLQSQLYINAKFSIKTNMTSCFSVMFETSGLGGVVLWDEASFNSWNHEEPLDTFLSGLARKALHEAGRQAALVEL